ncbi:uncharacterized protein LOC110013862 [Oryzias latipes]
MSSLQSLRELISERLAAAAEEICRLCEGTIVQYEEELCRQRRLLDVIWKPQLQLHHIVLPQHWMTEEEDISNQQRNFRVEQEEPEPPQIQEEQEEPEPPQIKEEPEPPQMKEEPGELCISQDEDQLDLKQETDTLMEIPTYEEDENSEADLNNQQSFNVTDSQDEEGNQHKESTSTTDEETDPQNRDQRKRRDRSHVQSVASSHMSAANPTSRLAAAAEEVCRLSEGTIVQSEEELCRQRRLLDVIWKPQLLLHRIVLPQHWSTEEDDPCNQQRNFRVEQEEPEPPHYNEELQDPEPPHYNEELQEPEPPHYNEELQEPEHPHYNEELQEPEHPHYNEELQEPEHPQFEDEHWVPEPLLFIEEAEEICISQDEDQLDLKQETDTLMEIPSYEGDENSEADLNNQQSFNVTDSQGVEGNQHEKSTSTTDGETDPKNRDQRKRKIRKCVQCVDSSHMSAGQCDSDVRKIPKKPSLGKKRKQSPNEERLFSFGPGKNIRIITNLSDYMETGSDERCYICKECGKSFGNISQFKIHARIHAKDKRFSCNECEKSYSSASHLDSHMITHTGVKPYSCKECDKRFSYVSHLKRHMRTHTGERPYWCMECRKGFMDLFSLKTHMRTHTGEKPFSCKECKRSFSQVGNLKIHMRTHKAFS